MYKKLQCISPGKHRLLFVLMALTTVGCSDSPGSISASSNHETGTENSELPLIRDTSIWPTLDLSAIKDPMLEQKVDELLSEMTLEQKVAQMIQPEIRDVTVEDMRRYGFGSYLNGGGAFPQNNKHATPQDWIKLAEDMYQASVDDSLDGSSIPAIWGTDAVHGHNNVIGATLFPHNIGLGAANNSELVEAIAEATAREVMATGIDWVFAPTVAVVRDDRWGRTYEGYSEDPEIVFEYSEAVVRGLQGAMDDDFLGEKRVISTVKHFVGDGGTDGGIDQGNNLANEQDLFNIHAQGYVGGLSAGAQTVMASFNSWQGDKLHGHRYLLTDVLKTKMGFDGFVVGDWLGHGQVPGCNNYSCSKAVNAGLDVYMASSDAWKPLMENTIAQVNNGEIAMSRIDDAVRRILRVKLRSGIFDKPSPANRPLSGKLEIIGAPEHRALARQAVRESLVLLKNKNSILPLNPNQHVLVAGDAADNIGKQSGGWTITWQGTGNTNSDFPGGSSIYAGFKQAVNNAGGSIELAVDGEYERKPDVAIVVFGENPYAEGHGDIKSVEYQPGNKTDLAIMKKLTSQGIPVVSVFVSGRPMWLNGELNASDAFVAAWLPGSEGVGVSDVLFAKADGEINHDFKGRLSFSWPAYPDQSVVNRHDPNYMPLLPYGFGLRYGDENVLPDNLDESLAEAVDTEQTELFLFRKSVQAPYRAMVSSLNRTVEVTNNVVELDTIRVRTLDKDVQEDARQLTFKGNGRATFSLTSTSPQDFSPYLEQQSVLTILMRLEKAPTGSVILSMDCGDDCSGELDITDQLTSQTLNSWQALNIDLSCLGSAGVDLTSVLTPFRLSSEHELVLSFSEISIMQSAATGSCGS